MLSRRALMTGAAGVGLAGAGAVGYRVWRDREPASPPAQDAAGHLLWRNWSGIRGSYPAQRAAPSSEGELAGLLKTAPAPIRPVGAGHSFTALVPTSGLLLTLDQMSGLVRHDADKLQATVRAGTRLGDLGPALAAIGQEMPNLPDINKQSLAGAISTGTHGTGRGITAIHGQVLSFRLATPKGDLLDCSPASNPEIYNAARVGLGAFGVVTEVTLQNQPLKRIYKRVELRDFHEVCDAWPELQAKHRNVEFYAIPFTGKVALITADPTDRPTLPRGPEVDNATLMDLKRLRDLFGLIPPLRRAVANGLMGDIKPEEMVDEGWKLLSNDRSVRFNEMEFHLPRETQIPALKEVMAAIEKHRGDVFFPIEARTIAADDAWLSPFYQRPSGSVAVHAYYKDDYAFLFDLIEPIFRRYDGRPHWGKLNSLGAGDFSRLYPRWKEACEVRAALDPTGRFLNPYLRKVFLGQS
ncbi:MAG: D-arabinono-1,4-lactone oxidase [Caulobacteraceae bacterium]|nr:D-arabinono-1,4-lactone oxidase [Caulobacteraceae bacterium]